MQIGRWIVYPETRFVSESTIRSWINDDIANGVTPPVDAEQLSLDDVCKILEDIGSVSFAPAQAKRSQLRAERAMELALRD